MKKLCLGFLSVLILMNISGGNILFAQSKPEKSIYMIVRFQKDVNAKETARSIQSRFEGTTIRHVYSNVFKGSALNVSIDHLNALLSMKQVEYVELNRKMSGR